MYLLEMVGDSGEEIDQEFNILMEIWNCLSNSLNGEIFVGH